MQHSIKEIGKRYQSLSDKRKDKLRFNALDFYSFALNNKMKHSIIENGDDLLVSTWYSDELIEDYKKTIRC